MEQNERDEHLKRRCVEYERASNIMMMKYTLLERIVTGKIDYAKLKKSASEGLYIYGVGTIGRALLKCICAESDIQVLGIIDKNQLGCFEGITISRIDEVHIPTTVLITPMEYYNEIDKELNELYSSIACIPLTEVVL